MKKIILITALLSCSLTTFAQKNFEGRLTSIERTKDGNKENTLLVKNEKIAVEAEKTENSFNINPRVILDLKKGTLQMIFDESAKYVTVDLNEHMKKAEDPWKNAKINKTGNKKNIAGYNCTEVEIFTPDQTAIYWIAEGVYWDNFTELIKKDNNSVIELLEKNNLKGLALSTVIKDSKGLVVKETIYTSVTEQKVDDAKFTIPKNYGETTMEAFFTKLIEEAQQKAQQDTKKIEQSPDKK